jgi:hypothetical protein
MTTLKEVSRELKALTYNVTNVEASRHRMSKEIAEELLAEKGAGAHFYCVEKLALEPNSPRMWRDVLAWLDELGGDDGLPKERGDSDLYGRGSEPISGATCDSEADAESAWRYGAHDGLDGDERRLQQYQE